MRASTSREQGRVDGATAGAGFRRWGWGGPRGGRSETGVVSGVVFRYHEATFRTIHGRAPVVPRLGASHSKTGFFVPGTKKKSGPQEVLQPP